MVEETANRALETTITLPPSPLHQPDASKCVLSPPHLPVKLSSLSSTR